MALPRVIPSDTRRALNATDPRWKLKTVLHSLTLLSSLAAITLFALSIPLWNANFFHNRGPNRGDWTDGISLGPLGFCSIVSSLSLAYTLAKRRPCPPKVTVATAVLILLSLAPALVLAGYGSLFKYWRPPAVRPPSGILKCNLTNILTRNCEPILYRVGELQIGGIIFGTITWLLIFITFIVSLYEHRTSHVQDAQRGRERGLKRLTLMVGGQRYHKNVEMGAQWAGSGSSHVHSFDHRSHEHRHERRREHRQHGTRYSRSGLMEGSGDVVPFMYVREPEMAYPHSGTRYM